MTQLELDIINARNQPTLSGMGAVKISYNPYTADWTCQFNWSNGFAIEARDESMIEAINKAIRLVNRTVTQNS